MIYFQQESHVASCKSIDGALKLADFMQKRFTNNPKYVESIKFRAVIETDGKINVHSCYPVNEIGRKEFKIAIADFLAEHSMAALPAAA